MCFFVVTTVATVSTFPSLVVGVKIEMDVVNGPVVVTALDALVSAVVVGVVVVAAIVTAVVNSDCVVIALVT